MKKVLMILALLGLSSSYCSNHIHMQKVGGTIFLKSANYIKNDSNIGKCVTVSQRNELACNHREKRGIYGMCQNCELFFNVFLGKNLDYNFLNNLIGLIENGYVYVGEVPKIEK